ncbi:hypothetical protein ISCGN_023571 [Ixodes scapularis]
MPALRLVAELWVSVKYDHMISHFAYALRRKAEEEVVEKSVYGLFEKVVSNTSFCVVFWLSTVPSEKKSDGACITGELVNHPPACIHAASRRHYAATNYKTINQLGPVAHAASQRPAPLAHTEPRCPPCTSGKGVPYRW